jgi:uncharacterized protein YbjT (DUF2867 family)
MKIAVTTPTGHIGSLIAECLLDAGADLRLLSRCPDKLSRLVNRGAGVAEGTLEDEHFVVKATRGAEALFWVTPPNLQAVDYRAFQNRVGRAAVEAIRINRIGRVVNLSAIGAHLGSGGGPINGLHDVEKLLDHVSTNIIHLRPAFFFENYLGSLKSIKDDGKIFLPVSGSRRIPMIATRDIVRLACDRLVDTSWTGRSVRGLHGPCDMSFDEAAQCISDGMERKVEHVTVDDEMARRFMTEGGMSESVCDLMLEMFRGYEMGTLRADEERSPETFTPTKLTCFAKEVMRPLVEEHVVY